MEQGVKRMQEFFHRFFLAGNELHVVHQQNVRLAVFAAQFGKSLAVLGAGSVNEFIRELFTRHVHHVCGGFLTENFMADGLQKMGFSYAGFSV